MLGGGSPMGGIMPGMGGGNNPMQMIQKFMEFKKKFQGKPSRRSTEDATVWPDNSAAVRPGPTNGPAVSADA